MKQVRLTGKTYRTQKRPYGRFLFERGHRMERILMKLKIDRIILYTVIFTLSACMVFRSLIIGIGFITIKEVAPGGTYYLLEQLFDIRIWGAAYLINAFLYVLGTALFLWRKHVPSIILSGITGALLMLFYVAASWDVSSSKIHTYGYIFTFALHIAIALLGGVAWLTIKQVRITLPGRNSKKR